MAPKYGNAELMETGDGMSQNQTGLVFWSIITFLVVTVYICSLFFLYWHFSCTKTPTKLQHLYKPKINWYKWNWHREIFLNKKSWLPVEILEKETSESLDLLLSCCLVTANLFCKWQSKWHARMATSWKVMCFKFYFLVWFSFFLKNSYL